MSSRRDDLDRFYAILSGLEKCAGGVRRLADCHGRMDWAQRGVYFFFEPGEFREDGRTPRVVRVGTHGLVAGKSTLWSRLSQHKGTTAGVMPGGGNHRGSIFRLHVGTALLATGTWPDEIRETWGKGSSASAEIRKREYPLEAAVTSHIGAMPFLHVEIGDAPGPASHRGVIEVGSIALLSNLTGTAIDRPGPSWLGRNADRPTIWGSGLWNVNHVSDRADGGFLDFLARYAGEQPA